MSKHLAVLVCLILVLLLAQVSCGARPNAAWMRPATAKPAKPTPPPANLHPLLKDPAYLNFVGAGAEDKKFYGPDPSFATALREAVLGYPGISFTMPKVNDVPVCIVETQGPWLLDSDPFTALMFQAVDPKSQQGNFYVDLTADTENRLESAILGSNGNLTPVAVMRMALQAAGGNYALATLTVHNLLKNIAYQGRQAREQRNTEAARRNYRPYPPRIGNIASRLVNMRSKPNDDKMGIWYHSFVPLTIAAWTDSPAAADHSIDIEYAVRDLESIKRKLPDAVGGFLPSMGSPTDPEKKKSDRQFAAAAHQIYDRGNRPQKISICDLSMSPTRGPVRTNFVVTCKYWIEGRKTNSINKVKERISVSGPINVVLSSQLLTIDPSTPVVKHKWEYVGLKPGKYFFEISLEYGQGYKTKIPFEVVGEPVNGWIRIDPPEIHNTPKSQPFFFVDLKKSLLTCARTSYSSYHFVGHKVYLTYSPPPKVLKQGQQVTLNLNLHHDDPHGAGFSANWQIGAADYRKLPSGRQGVWHQPAGYRITRAGPIIDRNPAGIFSEQRTFTVSAYEGQPTKIALGCVCESTNTGLTWNYRPATEADFADINIQQSEKSSELEKTASVDQKWQEQISSPPVTDTSSSPQYRTQTPPIARLDPSLAPSSAVQPPTSSTEGHIPPARSQDAIRQVENERLQILQSMRLKEYNLILQALSETTVSGQQRAVERIKNELPAFNTQQTQRMQELEASLQRQGYSIGYIDATSILSSWQKTRSLNESYESLKQDMSQRGNQLSRESTAIARSNPRRALQLTQDGMREISSIMQQRLKQLNSEWLNAERALQNACTKAGNSKGIDFVSFSSSAQRTDLTQEVNAYLESIR